MLAAAPPAIVPMLKVVFPKRGDDGHSVARRSFKQLSKRSIAEIPNSGYPLHVRTYPIRCVRMGRLSFNIQFKHNDSLPLVLIDMGNLLGDRKLEFRWLPKDYALRQDDTKIICLLHSDATNFLANNVQESYVTVAEFPGFSELFNCLNLSCDRSLGVITSAPIDRVARNRIGNMWWDTIDMRSDNCSAISATSHSSQLWIAVLSNVCINVLP